LTGLIHVLRRYEVGQIVVGGDVSGSDVFAVFHSEVIFSGIPVHLAAEGDELKLGLMEFDVVWPGQRSNLANLWETRVERDVLGVSAFAGDVNERSVVLELHYQQFDVLFAGDIGFQTEQALISRGVLDDLEVLKVGHHGSKYASSLNFLEKIKPELALISVSAKNSFGHPTNETLERLRSVGAEVLRTDELGDIEIVSNGEEYWVEEQEFLRI
jgi:competence protein ComEC